MLLAMLATCTNWNPAFLELGKESIPWLPSFATDGMKHGQAFHASAETPLGLLEGLGLEPQLEVPVDCLGQLD